MSAPEETPPFAGAFWASDGLSGVAVRLGHATVRAGWMVVELSPDEMVEMAEHLLVNARRKRAAAPSPETEGAGE